MEFGAKITQEMRDAAVEYQATTLENMQKRYGTTDNNYTGFVTSNRFIVGYLAELCFADVMRQHGIPDVLHLTNDQGLPDRADFKIHTDYVDVKFVPHSRNMFYHNMREWEKQPKKDFYVPVKIDYAKTTGVIYGYYTCEDVEAMPVREFRNGTQAKHKSIFEGRPFWELLERWRI